MPVAVRVIPCLDVHGGRVVKGVNFVDLRDAGDPVELGAVYDAEGADELTFLDISASVEGRETTLDVVRRTAETVFIPLTVGGGVSTVADVDLLLRAGADKVAINTGAIRRPEVIADITRRFGNQVLVLSVDARRAPAMPSGFEVTTHGGRRSAGLDAVEWARRGVDLGVGEILLNSMDADGTTGGFDLEMIRAVRAVVDVPLDRLRRRRSGRRLPAGHLGRRGRGARGDGVPLRHAPRRGREGGVGACGPPGPPTTGDPRVRGVEAWLRAGESPGSRTRTPTTPRQRLGGIPEGWTVDCYRADGPDWPDSLREVEFYVLPYMKGAEVLDRAAEMTNLKVIQTLTAGVENFLPAVPPGVTLCNAAGRARRQHRRTRPGPDPGQRSSARRLRPQPARGARGSRHFGRSLADQRVLIIGYGRIGAAIEARLAGFEVASVTRVARRARDGEPAVHAIGELADLLALGRRGDRHRAAHARDGPVDRRTLSSRSSPTARSWSTWPAGGW